MQIFYNKQGIGDVMIISLKPVNQSYQFTKYGNVVKIYSPDKNETLGYNIFQASQYISVEQQGTISVTQEWVDKIHQIFSQNALEDEIDVDLSPKFVVGYVKQKQPHKNADKLSVCQVDAGDEELQIVCGAPNVEEGQKVVVAKPGAVMPNGMLIKEAELRGVPSSGMICSAKELDLPDAPKEKGILVLDNEYKIGEPFKF
ncbi:tRNA-binding protein [Salinibacillus kushneri]|uniref:tRNA-binding protein n=1 Tax=Salinibacillus kushneri TaxID=237682 RepID=A0A1I0JCL3_9BACI|nr:DUF4479 family protein [Salinibacillus kushneri]SEU07781.1 tRNA-binding protein [Salinibacillus kushneri]